MVCCQAERHGRCVQDLCGELQGRGASEADSGRGQSAGDGGAEGVGDTMAEQAPLKFVFYIAAPAEKVWEGFVSEASNRAIFSTDFEIDLNAGGHVAWVGRGPD